MPTRYPLTRIVLKLIGKENVISSSWTPLLETFLYMSCCYHVAQLVLEGERLLFESTYLSQIISPSNALHFGLIIMLAMTPLLARR